MRKSFYKFGCFSNSWWQSIDHTILVSLMILLCFGMILVTAASPAIAGRIGIDKSFFIIRHGIYLLLASTLIIAISTLSKETIRRLALGGFILSLGLLLSVKFLGYEIKGAKRWISILGISLQPSEFIKPCFFIISGWILSIKFEHKDFPAVLISSLLYCIVAIFLLMQPDVGTVMLLSISWLIQLFVSGMPLLIILALILLGIFGFFLAYNFFPHVAGRINTFLGTDVSNNYQITKSLLAYKKGGFFGLGPAEGIVKYSLPDSHTDFIFSVAAEEFGSITCIAITLIFCLITIRTLFVILRQNNYYVMLASIGIIAQFIIQAMINMSTSLNLIPTKGMTLPFISYGGSSILATSISMGVILSFTKKQKQNYIYKVL